MKVGGFGNHTLLQVDESDLDKFGHFVCEDENIIAIGEGAFGNVAQKLTSAKFAKVIHIGQEAFAGCKKLQSFEYCGGGILRIGDNAFSDCASLKSFDFLCDTKIYGSAFENCNNLREVFIAGEMYCMMPKEVYDALCAESEQDGTDPDFKIFAKVAFYKCPNIQRVEIGEEAQLLSIKELSYLPNLREVKIDGFDRKRVFWRTACRLCPESFRLLPSELYWDMSFLHECMLSMKEPLKERFGPKSKKVFNYIVKNKDKYEDRKKQKRYAEYKKMGTPNLLEK